MKTLKISSLSLCLLLASFIVSAQAKTESFKVSGNCGMCKSRIEKAAKDAGATEAKWEADTKELTVTYESSLTNAAKIQQKIAEVGHDNNGYTAADEVYRNLPPCCKYERASGISNAVNGKDCCKDGKKCKDGEKCKDGKKCKDGDKCKDGKKCKNGNKCKDGGEGKDCCKKA